MANEINIKGTAEVIKAFSEDTVEQIAVSSPNPQLVKMIIRDMKSIPPGGSASWSWGLWAASVETGVRPR
jgi:hypothetical protein